MYAALARVTPSPRLAAFAVCLLTACSGGASLQGAAKFRDAAAALPLLTRCDSGGSCAANQSCLRLPEANAAYCAVTGDGLLNRPGRPTSPMNYVTVYRGPKYDFVYLMHTPAAAQDGAVFLPAAHVTAVGTAVTQAPFVIVRYSMKASRQATATMIDAFKDNQVKGAVSGSTQTVFFLEAGANNLAWYGQALDGKARIEARLGPLPEDRTNPGSGYEKPQMMHIADAAIGLKTRSVPQGTIEGEVTEYVGCSDTEPCDDAQACVQGLCFVPGSDAISLSAGDDTAASEPADTANDAPAPTTQAGLGDTPRMTDLVPLGAAAPDASSSHLGQLQGGNLGQASVSAPRTMPTVRP